MKNPIRAWVAKVAREEIYEERRERNLEAIKAEESAWVKWTQLRQAGLYDDAEAVLNTIGDLS